MTNGTYFKIVGDSYFEEMSRMVLTIFFPKSVQKFYEELNNLIEFKMGIENVYDYFGSLIIIQHGIS